MDCECDYCKNNFKVPKDYFKIIFNNIKSKKNKKLFISFILLNIPFCKLKEYNIYIPFYEDSYLLDIRKQINYIYNDVGYIKCNYCDKTACPSHYLWSNFHNTKCIKCNKFMSICGWCNKTNICITCYENINYPLNF